VFDVSKTSGKLCAALSDVLSEARLDAGLSLGAAAELSGLNRQAITFIERGDRNPTTETLAKLSLALGLLPSEAWNRAEKRLKLRKKNAVSLSRARKNPKVS
jgi:transcriptional regulator with XRE-family HTH domain